jgi:release factor glutamine methyltransferase
MAKVNKKGSGTFLLTLHETLQWGVSRLREARVNKKVPDPFLLTLELDAGLLLAHVLGKPRSYLFGHPDAVLGTDADERFRVLVERRRGGEPVAYLTGRKGFWSLELEVSPAVLVPRPESELLVELALARLPANAAMRVADMGTGSGALALALAAERPRLAVLATDADPAALAVARRNAERLGLGNVAFREGDWFAAFADGERFDLLISNPPYIAENDPHLAALAHEPRAALVAGEDGLDALRRTTDARRRPGRRVGRLGVR